MGVRLSASPNLFGPVINQDYYGDTSLGLLVTRPLWIPQVWRGDGPQVDSVSVFIIYYHSWILRLRSSSTCSSMLVGACGSYYSTYMSTILQVLVVSTRSSRLFIVKIFGCTSRSVLGERLPYSSHPDCCRRRRF